MNIFSNLKEHNQDELPHLVPEFLDHGIVGVLVGHVEGGVDGAPVRILKN
jgi:hypothetical protein